MLDDGVSPYYFAATRKTVVAMGTLFNNVKLARTASVGGGGTVTKLIKVPLAYAPVQSYTAWLRGALPIDKMENQEAITSKILPRMAYSLKSMSYDKGRQLPSTNRIYGTTRTTNPDGETIKSMMEPMPWNFDFELFIVTKNLDDGYNIIEQIIPNFKPNYPITVNYVPELDIKYDVPVIFNGINQMDNYELQMGEKRMITWTLDFTAKGYMFPPLRDTAIIKRVINPLFTDTDPVRAPHAATTITTEVDPFTAEFDDPYIVTQTSVDTIDVGEAAGVVLPVTTSLSS